jgi:hypothetical protein
MLKLRVGRTKSGLVTRIKSLLVRFLKWLSVIMLLTILPIPPPLPGKSFFVVDKIRIAQFIARL